jgi:hypothetical protein
MTARAAKAGRRLRVGVLLSSPHVRAWVWTALRDIGASGHAEIVAVARTPARRRRLGPLWGALRRADELLDRPIPAGEDAFLIKDARPLLAGVPVLRMHAGAGGAGTFAAEDVASLRALDLDVLLWFGDGRRPRGDVLRAARAGAWSLRFGDSRRRRGGPPGFWEVHHGWPVAGAALEILADDPEPNRTLHRTSAATVATSVKRTRNSLVWTALPLLGRALAELHRDGLDRFLERVERENAAPSFYSSPRFGSPGVTDIVVHGVRRAARLGGLLAKRPFTRQQWVLYYGLADDLIEDCFRLEVLAPPVDRFWADPHVLMVGERYFVFVEEMLYARGKGRIAVIEIGEDGRAGPARAVLEEAHHLSYPLVFEHDGAYFMVPESAQRGTVDLYRATSFPDRWTFVEHLMTGIDAYDATLLRTDDRWWLFASVIKHRGAGSGELNLYSSERLIGGEWRLHPASPLCSDVSGERPAGAIFMRNGRWYRPAQDGSGVYGRAIQLNEILELTVDAYRERLVSRIEPDWDRRITRTHTLAHAGRLTVVDALWTRGRWRMPTAGREAAPGAADDQPRGSLRASS